MYEFKLYLYISGQAFKSMEDVQNLKALLDKRLKKQYSFEIVNVLDHPQRAQEDKILATPTLIKIAPPPEKRVVGDLSDEERVLMALGLTAEKQNREVAQQ